MCPDNVVLLANVAARTRNVRLGTSAVILPWNDPLRVAEKMIMLDILSGGRAILGMGRGLSRVEYAPFGIPMAESANPPATADRRRTSMDVEHVPRAPSYA